MDIYVCLGGRTIHVNVHSSLCKKVKNDKKTKRCPDKRPNEINFCKKVLRVLISLNR